MTIAINTHTYPCFFHTPTFHSALVNICFFPTTTTVKNEHSFNSVLKGHHTYRPSPRGKITINEHGTLFECRDPILCKLKKDITSPSRV